MKAQTLFTKAAAGLGTVALTLALGCAHHNMAQAAGQQTGELRTEQAAQQNDTTSGNTLGTAPAPANTQAATTNPGTPAVISGPAAVDSTGRVYTSSSVGSAGNAANVGLNTNVNIIPKNQSTATVTTSQMSTPAPIVTTETTTTQTAEVTPAPAPTYTPAPVVEPTPAPTVESTPAPMTSSTEQTTTTTENTTSTTTTTRHHRRMRKD